MRAESLTRSTNVPRNDHPPRNPTMMLRNSRRADSASSAGCGTPSSPIGPSADYEAVSFNRARLTGTKWAKMPLVIKAKYLVSEPPSARTAEWLQATNHRLRARTADAARRRADAESAAASRTTRSRGPRTSAPPAIQVLDNQQLPVPTITRTSAPVSAMTSRRPSAAPSTTRSSGRPRPPALTIMIPSADDDDDGESRWTSFAPLPDLSPAGPPGVSSPAMRRASSAVTAVRAAIRMSRSVGAHDEDGEGKGGARRLAASAPVRRAPGLERDPSNVSVRKMNETKTMLRQWKADMVQKLVERQPSAITAIVLKDLVARPLSTYVSAAERRVAVSAREVQRVHGLMAIEGGDD
ncbi:hypothetical protein AMAG_07488 [Allomyces macrogynus ATCC 38327]|uniref:Uncharacterized protein n=1 Tax=Allomyces macrogynus (strain ATCC 38327) TaxID=578462 RepID=A0A0L0SIS9_ALLM3|nr:hypothetical protein AMAG_07488 [Allomyces macrogynus ATCC 38327]|eukprot:KNE62250.1 hypothetical protein AMAG_07488 [Allomyces macrogynus ATCC 38327]